MARSHDLFPVYPRRRNAASAPEGAHYKRRLTLRATAPAEGSLRSSGVPTGVLLASAIVPPMHAELDTLEAKIRQVAELCHTLRQDNLALRQQLLAAQQDNKQLSTRLDAAKTRLQALLDTLPEDV